MQEIRHISTQFNSNVIAVAEFEKTVQIVDVLNQVVISEFETILDYGGRRLAISEDSQSCICGSWARYGICCYDINTGSLIWQRKDLKKVQHIQTLRSDTNIVFAQFNTGASRLLNINDGSDVKKMPGVKLYFESKFQPIDIYDKSTKIEIIDRQTSLVKLQIDHRSFATLDIAFSPGSFLISEAGGPVSCYDIENGKLKWRWRKNEEEHYTNVGFNEDLGIYVCLSHPFEPHDKKIIYIDCQSGQIKHQINIKRPLVTKFLLDSQFVLTSERDLMSVKTGNIIKW
jgi:WD40 repeat protein